MIRRPPRSTLSSSSAASDVYKRQDTRVWEHLPRPSHVQHNTELKALVSYAFGLLMGHLELDRSINAWVRYHPQQRNQLANCVNVHYSRFDPHKLVAQHRYN